MQALQTRFEAAPRNPWPSEPVRLALVITELDVGGAEKALVELVRRLDGRRWLPLVVALGPEAPLAAPLRELGIEVRCLGVDRRRPVRAVAQLAGVLRRFRPQLVQSFLFHANIASRLAARAAGRPWVLGAIRVAERGQGWHLTGERLTQRLGAGSICVSAGVQRWMIERARIAPERLMVIPNGVELVDGAAAPRSRLTSRPSGPLALFVGRLEHQKGVDTLLDAARQVLAERPDWSLAIAGDGPLRAELEGRAQASPELAAAVRFLGRRDDVPELLRVADLLVLPSRWEGMPNVVLEAMAAGKPVVATRVEGTEELVREGQTGWLVPPDDAQALALALAAAASDPALAGRLGRAGRAVVEQSYTLAAAARAYQDVWARILGLEPNGTRAA